VWAIEGQIYSTPANSAVGLSIKAAMLIQMEDENAGEFEEQASYAYKGKLRLDLQALKGLAEDAARFVPELAPLVAPAVNTPMELPPIRAELRERAEALAAEYDAPLAEGDAGLIEAERRLHELEPRRVALGFGSTIAEEDITNIAFNAMCRLDERIATMPATTLAGAAVKLRRLLHPELGIETNSENDVPCLHQILAVIEQGARS